MKMTVHHLPTGCRWEVEIYTETFVEELIETLNKERGLFIKGSSESICFPARILKESVIKVVE